jgi:SH3-like domain-containing protein
VTFALAVASAVAPVAAMAAHPTGVVVRREASLLDAASPTASAIGSLRLGEAVPIDEETSGYLRVEDSSGARGWARRDDVWPLDRPPAGP